MENLVAARILPTLRIDGDKRSLDMFMSDVIGRVDPDYLYQSRVVRWLGQAQTIGLPKVLGMRAVDGFVYQAADDPTNRYCFVYKDHWLPTMAGDPPDVVSGKRPRTLDDGMVDKNYPVLDRLYRIEDSATGPQWILIRQCPASPRDTPSGRYRLEGASIHRM